MRRRIRSELGTVTYGDFLVFLMGPYTTFDVRSILPESVEEGAVTLPSEKAGRDAVDEMMATLRRVQGHLRVDPGVNAFLAVDPGISLDEIDAATQSIRFARASNAVAFVVPALGDNLGVGIEAGAVLEDLYPDTDRVLLVHEDVVSSAMLASVTRRWDARIATYADEAELVDALRHFVGLLMYREATGDLPRKGT